MRVPDGIRDCAAYILATTPTGDRDKPFGTAFFVSVESETLSTEVRHIYLVTAKHLLLNGEGLSLRFNGKDGKVHKPVPLPNASQWYRLEDEGVDVAALFLDDDYAWLADVDYEPVPLENTFNDHMTQEFQVGIGDELLVTGLFITHPGKERNIPIVRSGIIAAMAGDEFRDEKKDRSYGPPYRAHLVELRSTGGLSGSPVFVVIGPARTVIMQSSTTWDAGGGIGQVSWRLLGLIHGHSATNAAEGARAHVMYDSDYEGVNRGIAKVVPSQYIRELLLTGQPKADRIERDKKRLDLTRQDRKNSALDDLVRHR